MRGRRAVVVAGLVGVLGLAGCSPGDDGGSARPTDAVTASSAASSPGSPTPEPSSSPSPSVSASPSARPSPVPVTGPDQKLVTMTVSGGYAGVSKKVVLRGDGTVRATDEGRTVVRRTGAAQFTKLRTLLGDPALDEVPEFTIDMGAADMFQYTLQFDGRTVMTDRSAGQPALDRLIGALEAWLPKG
ncbi:hypothetical protein [Streptomyces lincolnensis]|uniref:hypothetical protein n=1 Tax=Streptomyces lincolnensis TaxID=1915 RepID=UPI00082954E9|nr:hypothetical protein [Streptomyces lincolnensis]QMV05133.1 hypothetical protein GJU35_05345 [Streptomyces lincolnensis]